MNRLSWDTSSLRRPKATRPDALELPDPAPHDDLLRPAWRELRRIHRF